jgi:twitching motility protein PilT
MAIECPLPAEDWMNKIVEAITPVHLKKRLDQEREIDFSYFIPGIGRFRTNLFQQRGQWCLAMRYVKTLVPSFQELGLLEQIKGIAESPRGIVLVAGSTGCGKSTTLAAMIEHINATYKKHIITLEDPIEYVFEDNQSVVEQREVGLDTLSFHHALKHILRQDPGHNHDWGNARFNQFHRGNECSRYRPPGAVDFAHDQRSTVSQPHFGLLQSG